MVVTAVPHTLTVPKSGTGVGTATSAPDRMDCGNDCSGRFPAGYAVVRSAAARVYSDIHGAFPDLVNISVSAPRSVKVGTSMSLSDTVANVVRSRVTTYLRTACAAARSS
jgi:hypothetical protein